MTILDQIAFADVPLSDEPALIARAQSGDEEAMTLLIGSYIPLMKASVRLFRRDDVEDDDLAAAAMEGFLVAVREYNTDLTTPLGIVAKPVIRRHVALQAAPVSAVSIPEKTMSRFRAVLREANGDAVVGAQIAPRFDLSRESFLALFMVTASTVSTHDVSDGDDDDAGPSLLVAPPTHGPEDVAVQTMYVNYLLSLIEGEERAVIEPAYGFYPEYQPVPMTEIAHRLGVSRATAYRRHESAIAKMRESLAHDLEV